MLLYDVSVLEPAQHIFQPIRLDLERALQVVWPDRGLGQLSVATLFEAHRTGVFSFHVGDTSEP